MKRIEHREEKWAFPFVAYTPSEVSGKLPLIVQLHGAGERGNGQDELSRVDVHGFSKFVRDGEYPCMFVMPQCPSDSFWVAHIESILRLVEQVKEAYDVDEDKIYLTGISMGGYGTWYTAMAKPDLFAAIAPCCGGGMPWNAGVLKMPVWVTHGAADSVVSTSESDKMVEALKNAGTEVIYSRLEGVDHNSWDYTFKAELLEWLLSKKK